ncbi:MAG: HAD hydrolase family protein [Burkholderiaceae bacterium]|jgi:3-deoxy-D-manno-octulosonate 8-phosphate phosphatase (KDO 8-P phosphatase)|nr:HAD hydrolase family protein [Burkholderiaceae bacterium]MDH5207377.1 HAD hydrolase family protein [Burkholderiaceae bacterium]
MTPEQRAARISLVAIDVDGVLTDGRLYYGPHGEALKVFDVRDGHGIKMLLGHGVDVAILSARSSEIVAARARELGIRRVLQGRGDKALGWTELLADAAVPDERAGYIGDDLPDLPVLARAGLAATVADARDEVKAAAHWITPEPGGRGAVRALAEFILRAKRIDFAGMTRG